MTDVSPLERVRAYYRDLNTGNSDTVARNFTPDANHFYTRLPTNRSARAFSGITLDDYLKKINVIEFSAKALRRFSKTIKEFSSIEGMDGHYRSAQMRLDREPAKLKYKKVR